MSDQTLSQRIASVLTNDPPRIDGLAQACRLVAESTMTRWQAMAEELDPSVVPDRTAWENLARQAVREYEALKARIAAEALSAAGNIKAQQQRAEKAEGEPSAAESLANELRAEGWEDTGTPPAGPPSAAERLLWLIASYNATRGRPGPHRIS